MKEVFLRITQVRKREEAHVHNLCPPWAQKASAPVFWVVAERVSNSFPLAPQRHLSRLLGHFVVRFTV